MDALSDGTLAAIAGLVGGIFLGLAGRLGRFCTLGAIEDMLYGRDNRRMKMWALAIAVAIAGSFTLMSLGWFDPKQTIYFADKWNPLASIFGGLIFGYGMALSGNCGYGALTRMGGGDLRAFVIVIVMAIAAYMAISGPTATLRVWLFAPQPAPDGQIQGIAHQLGSAFGIPPLVPALAIAAAAAIWALSTPGFRKDHTYWLWSSVVGIVIFASWAATQWIANTGFDQITVVSHTFAAPLGQTLLYFMTTSGSTISFGVGSVVGVPLGAFIGSLIKGHFRWEACEDPRELRRQIGGAFLMGTGAVIALGCTVGQGISAFSLLAYSAPVVFASIFAGAALGLRHLIVGHSVESWD